jgi:peptidyl-tRNA hydrolase, PTH1 family
VLHNPSGKPIIVVGLGNPGRGYARHRHNLGFMVVDRLAEDTRQTWSKNKDKTLICETELENQPAVLVKPQTYMNLSGKAVAPVVDRYKAAADRMVVIHDDLDLAAGRARVKVGGGDGGHKGIRSIADSLRFRDFVRVRLGIGRPPTGVSPEEFVLTPFAQEEQELLQELIHLGCHAVRLIILEGVVPAQNLLHSRRLATGSSP